MDRDDDVDDDVSLLVIVLETNSRCWFPKESHQNTTKAMYPFEKVCKAIASFSSAYLACNRANRIAIVAAHERKECTFLFRSHLEGDFEPKEEEEEKENTTTTTTTTG
mmetsp:Transcript_3361/g.10347  ORF Transcript_3361/g.10347 Transcript_3361/m.10347 type:complete len:108 (-) Transcript_3361:10-333(-)